MSIVKFTVTRYYTPKIMFSCFFLFSLYGKAQELCPVTAAERREKDAGWRRLVSYSVQGPWGFHTHPLFYFSQSLRARAEVWKKRLVMQSLRRSVHFSQQCLLGGLRHLVCLWKLSEYKRLKESSCWCSVTACQTALRSFCLYFSALPHPPFILHVLLPICKQTKLN